MPPGDGCETSTKGVVPRRHILATDDLYEESHATDRAAPRPLTHAEFVRQLSAGRTFITNEPVLEFTVCGGEIRQPSLNSAPEIFQHPL